MKKQVLLVTAPSSDRWVHLFRDVTVESADDLTILSPDGIDRAGAEEKFDVAFVDVAPLLEMKRIVAGLRSHCPAGRIIVLTAAPSWRGVREAIHAGADDYRPKSYDADELRKMIRSSKISKPATGGHPSGWPIEGIDG